MFRTIVLVLLTLAPRSVGASTEAHDVFVVNIAGSESLRSLKGRCVIFTLRAETDNMQTARLDPESKKAIYRATLDYANAPEYGALPSKCKSAANIGWIIVADSLFLYRVVERSDSRQLQTIYLSPDIFLLKDERLRIDWISDIIDDFEADPPIAEPQVVPECKGKEIESTCKPYQMTWANTKYAETLAHFASIAKKATAFIAVSQDSFVRAMIAVLHDKTPLIRAKPGLCHTTDESFTLHLDDGAFFLHCDRPYQSEPASGTIVGNGPYIVQVSRIKELIVRKLSPECHSNDISQYKFFPKDSGVWPRFDAVFVYDDNTGYQPETQNPACTDAKETTVTIISPVIGMETAIRSKYVDSPVELVSWQQLASTLRLQATVKRQKRDGESDETSPLISIDYVLTDELGYNYALRLKEPDPKCGTRGDQAINCDHPNSILSSAAFVIALPFRLHSATSK